MCKVAYTTEIFPLEIQNFDNFANYGKLYKF